MQEPVVSMTPFDYFTRWIAVFAVVFPIACVGLYFTFRYACRWGIEHGMARFVSHEQGRE